MYQNENNARGCKAHTKAANKDWNATNSINRMHGDNCDQCSSNDIRCVLNAMELARWLTTSYRSSRVVIRWNGTTSKQCAIDVTT